MRRRSRLPRPRSTTLPMTTVRAGLLRVGASGALLAAALLYIVTVLATQAAAAPRYAWTPSAQSVGTLESRIPPPAGFKRAPAEAGSWGEWLRNLPMKPDGAPVLLHTGDKKWRQDAHVAVIDIDVGKRDLQQCADAIMRLRAEWLYAAGRTKEIGFNYTDGKRRSYGGRGGGYPGFRKYMDQVFAYAGTYSLDRELKPAGTDDIRAGDVFIKGGFPGHAVLVADVAVNAKGEKRFLLVQSYMPAQEMHVLKNPNVFGSSPWYAADFGETLVTPEWTFSRAQMKRWP